MEDRRSPKWELVTPLPLFFFFTLTCPDGGVSSVDSVFIFQSSAEEAPGTSYDAIVVEQWTVVDVRVLLSSQIYNMRKQKIV